MAKSVEKFPEKDKRELVKKTSLFTGGCAVNTSIDLTKIGVNSAIIVKVGNEGMARGKVDLVHDKIRHAPVICHLVNTTGLC